MKLSWLEPTSGFISLKLEVKIFATQCKYRQTADTAHSLFLYESPGVRGSAASPMRRAQECTATYVAHTVDVWPMPAHGGREGVAGQKDHRVHCLKSKISENSCKRASS